ncbi:MAG: hypothetical protein QOG94_3175 [Solirubrobacteraceae bacterium]|jgi:hypothetical protein|nr:hypothetical protein [Solirubrobacteraceae bacterium]
MASAGPDVRVTVTVADSALAEIEQLAGRLRRAGMAVDAVLGAIGIITGSVASARLASIRTLPGVAAVEEQTTFQIAPPDADVQ